MDHSAHQMDDHSEHGMPALAKCSMHMLWNTQIVDTCIVFPSWHVRSTAGCVPPMPFTIQNVDKVLVQLHRLVHRNHDPRCILLSTSVHSRSPWTPRIALSLVASNKGKARLTSGTRSGRSSPSDEDASLLTGRKMFKVATAGTPVPFLLRVLRATLYGATVFLSFFLMLVFMTYNAYLIFATVFGAALGHYVFGGTINIDALLSEEAKGMACH
ncbi:Ctr copper transporter family-domain-containing protein [Mycena filopes]|nr:Ctr copper transporter family-domain-containing protein [Mycena filopes]